MTRNYKMKFIVYFTLFISIVSCANYRTNTEVEFDSTKVPHYDKSIPVLETDLKDKQYSTISEVEAVVKKLTLFHSRPTNEQANYVLRHIAKEKNADAIINVKYDYGFGFDSWGVLTAKGMLVKYSESEE